MRSESRKPSLCRVENGLAQRPGPRRHSLSHKVAARPLHLYRASLMRLSTQQSPQPPAGPPEPGSVPGTAPCSLRVSLWEAQGHSQQTALGPRVQTWETVPDQGSVSPAPQTGRSQACRHRRPNVASAGHGPLTSCCHIASPCPALPRPVGQSPCLPGNPSGKQRENSKDQKEFRLQKHTECSANFHRTGFLLTLETRGSGL